jgi:L-ascorbate metabolism protein UlaG (beta-lactamase superfamily)
MILPLTLLVSCLYEPKTFDEASWRSRVNSQDPSLLYAPHHKDGRYFNPWMEDEKGFGDFISWRLTRSVEYTEEEESYLPKVEPDLMRRISELPPDRDFLVWVGHATFLIRISGSYWLTDPMLSERALLPKRVTPPALSLEDLRTLDGVVTVLLSHNHYDHLDSRTLRSLPPQARIIVPPGLGGYVSGLHEGEVIEVDWWETTAAEDSLITGLPAQHWSRRIGQGRNATLWSSYMIEAAGLRIYYGADSGFFVGYREFGEKFGQIDYALLPITAYQPRWFMHYAHTNVDEALLAFEQLKARWFVPTQWGTFRLGDNPPGYPILDLKRQLAARELDPGPFLLPDLGQIVYLTR